MNEIEVTKEEFDEKLDEILHTSSSTFATISTELTEENIDKM